MNRPVALLLAVSVTAAAPYQPATAGSAQAPAQYSVVHTFPALDLHELYAPLARGSDGNFYGTTYRGGTHNNYGGTVNSKGTVFRMTPAGAVTVLHEFVGGADGAFPVGGLVQATDGNFYGTTLYGGPSDLGTVFRMTPAGAVTVLHAFTGGAGGSYPNAALVQVGAMLYGTAVLGGTSSQGVVYGMTLGGTYAVVHALQGAEGSAPEAPLLLASDGYLYGTAFGGGASGRGTVFRVTTGGVCDLVHAFTGGDGAEPYAGLIQATDGNLYGTASSGGSAGAGTIFRMTLGGTTTVLHEFDANASTPYGGLVQATDGYLYGTTFNSAGGMDGWAFKMATDGTFTKLFDFYLMAGGSGPMAAMVEGVDGNLYGTTFFGSAGGTAFRITQAGKLEVLHHFNGNAEGHDPSSLLWATDGSFYGTASGGGLSGNGTAFRMTPAGAVTVLYTFTNGADGAAPWGLLQAADGHLYGTAGNIVFRLTLAGAFSVLHTFGDSFDAGGSRPGRLMQGADGNFYGLTADGGDIVCGYSGCGTAFRLSPGGAHTVLHSFNGDGDGMWSKAGLVQGTDGNFYGTTGWGGGVPCYVSTHGCGTFFRMTPGGDLEVLRRFPTYEFTFLGGTTDQTSGTLAMASNGLFFGFGVTSTTGAIVEASSEAGLLVRHAFTGGTDGTTCGILVQAPDGWLYGAGESVFRMTTTGAFDVLYAGASASREALVRHGDGSFYGLGSQRVFRVRKTTQPFTDDTLVAGATFIKVVHVTELRARIDAVRTVLGLPGYGWTDALTPGASPVRALHVAQLRAALAEAYTKAKLVPPIYTDPGLGSGTPVKAVHIKEIRDALIAME